MAPPTVSIPREAWTPAIDSAIGMDEVPSSSHLLKLLSVIKETACKVGWFRDGDIRNDLLLMANEVINGFSHTNKMIIEPSYAHSRVLDIISRFYPRMKVEHIVTSFDAKAGYGTFIADFHISQSMSPPHFENLVSFLICSEDIPGVPKVSMVKWLLVARTDNMDTAACIASPSNVEFFLNGSGVPKRTKGDMGKGPHSIPSKLLAKIRQLIRTIMNLISSPDPPQLQDYVQPMSEKVNCDGDVIQISSWISLNCPISQFRIKTPAKGYLCKHPQILNEAPENISDVIISTDGSWMTSMTKKSEINETNRDTTSQNNHVTDNTENHTTIEANDTIDNSSSASVSASAEPPCTSWQSTVTTPAVFSSPFFRDPRLPPLVTCDPVVPPSSTPHMNSVNLTTRSTAQVSYSLTNPNYPSPQAQPQQGRADRPLKQTLAQVQLSNLKVQCKRQVKPSSPHLQSSYSASIALPFEYYSRKGQQTHYTDSEQSQVSIDRIKQAQNTTMFKPDATSSPHSIGLAVALAFEHLKRGDGQQHYIPPGQSQPSIARPFKFRRVDELHYSTGQSPANSCANKQAQDTTMLTPVRLPPSGQVDVQLRKGAHAPTGPTTKTPSLDSHLITARTSMLGQDVQQHYTTPRLSKVNVGKTKQVQSTNMLPPAAVSSLRSVPPGYEQRRYTPGHSQAQSLNERPVSQTRLPEPKGDAPPRQPT
ncbi:E4 SUMO-protein ligase PIAL2 isoform X1 [Tanacetum coccineum]